LRGKGIPRPAGGRGDCHVRTTIETPVELPVDARELLGRLGDALEDAGAALPRRQAMRDAIAARAAASAGPDANDPKAASASRAAEGPRG
jgi:DnaJ-class molecular chaperone